jgi:ATP-dependent DNA helicase DinG
MNKDRQPKDPIAAVLGPGGLLASRLPSYEPRAAQLSMARAVAECFADSGRLVVEAGTGTGKTFAYLVPAVLSGLKVVVSTGTKTLQEQIFGRDLPLLLGAMGLAQLPVACMKGIGNYLCLRRLAEAQRFPELLADGELARLLRWAEQTGTGDRAELAGLPDSSPLWAEVSPTPESRIGPRCRFYEDCHVTAMRRRAAGARLLVVNHHLLLADLAMRARHPDATVIPPFDALILDEAHQLEAIATSFFGQAASSGRIAGLARDLARSARLFDDPAVDRLARQLSETSADLFTRLANALPDEGASTGRIRLEQPPLASDPALEAAYFRLDAVLDGLAQHLRLRAVGEDERAHLAGRVEAQRAALALFASPPERGFILWAEPHRSGLSLHASPVEVGPILGRTLLAEPLPIVFTSATLATAIPEPVPVKVPVPAPVRGGEARSAEGSTSYFRDRVGLRADEVTELVLPSPFAFERQVLLYVPRDLPDPSRPEFLLRAAERMCQLIDLTAGRALVLFTSYRNLQAAREVLSAQLDYPVLCQGEAPRGLLLSRFRREVQSVLLATSSFWEGVDVVGESLSLVIIDKLPFAVPVDPLTSARIEVLRERGEEPFQRFQLPQAALSLRQGFGRLVRHRSDRGIVAILDRRLHQRSYGPALLDSLPRSPRTSDLLHVRAFAKNVLGFAGVDPSRSAPPTPDGRQSTVDRPERER